MQASPSARLSDRGIARGFAGLALFRNDFRPTEPGLLLF
jgi:hypothetical protein